VDCTWGLSHPYRDSRESGQHLPSHTLGISYPLYARVRDRRKPVMSAIQEHLHSITVSSLPSPQKYTQHLLSGTPAFHDHAHVGVRSHAGATSSQSPCRCKRCCSGRKQRPRLLMLPSAAQQFRLEVASSLVSPRVDSHVCDPKDGPGYHLSIRGWGCR